MSQRYTLEQLIEMWKKAEEGSLRERALANAIKHRTGKDPDELVE